MRAVPPSVQVIQLPRPSDTRDLFDFSGGKELIDEAHRLAGDEIDKHVPPAVAAERKRNLPRRKKTTVA